MFGSRRSRSRVRSRSRARTALSGRRSRRLFRRTSGSHRRNARVSVMRGGYRL